MRNVKFIISDIDGVLTDGTFLMDWKMQEWKQICYRDLDSIRMGRTNGFEFIFLTAENTDMSHTIGQRFGVETIEGAKDKLTVLTQICQERNILSKQVCYLGDSDRDVEALRFAGVGVVPQDGTSAARKSADYIASTCGGKGVLFETVKMLIAAKKAEE